MLDLNTVASDAFPYIVQLLQPTTFGVISWCTFVFSLFILSYILPSSKEWVRGRADECTNYPPPQYKINGLRVIMIWSMLYAALCYIHVLSPSLIIDHFSEILSASFLWVCCLTLLHWVIPKYITKRVSPLTTTYHIPKYLEWFYGVELHPSFFGLDCKTFAYRPGMLGYALIVSSLAYKQYVTYHTLGRFALYIVILFQHYDTILVVFAHLHAGLLL